MKKSKAITLVLVTGLLGCNRHHTPHTRLYMRTDTIGGYTPATPGYQGYYVFSAYGSYFNQPYYGSGGYGGYATPYGGRVGYIRQGYSSSSVHSSEGSVSRGGFGESGGFHASSS